MSFTEEKKNLFDVDDSYALAHCVGADFIMGAGIAVQFRKQFKEQVWLKKNSRGIGTSLLLPVERVGRNVFYLITKRYSTGKPTYECIEASIRDMFKQASEHKIKKIAMPRIACGLDGKTWETIRDIIKKHQPNDIDVFVALL